MDYTKYANRFSLWRYWKPWLAWRSKNTFPKNLAAMFSCSVKNMHVVLNKSIQSIWRKVPISALSLHFMLCGFPLQGQRRVQVTQLIQKSNVRKNVSVPANGLHGLNEGKSFSDHEEGQSQSRRAADSSSTVDEHLAYDRNIWNVSFVSMKHAYCNS